MLVPRFSIALAAIWAVKAFNEVPSHCTLQPGDDFCPPGCAGEIVYVVDGTSTSTITTVLTINTIEFETTTSTTPITSDSPAPETTTSTAANNTPEPETTILTCPDSNGQVFSGQTGSTFRVDCAQGIEGVEINARGVDPVNLAARAIGTTNSFNGCIQLCDDLQECQGVSYNPVLSICRGFAGVTISLVSSDEWVAIIVTRANPPESETTSSPLPTRSPITTSTSSLRSTTRKTSTRTKSTRTKSTRTKSTMTRSSRTLSTASFPTDLFTDSSFTDTISTEPVTFSSITDSTEASTREPVTSSVITESPTKSESTPSTSETPYPACPGPGLSEGEIVSDSGKSYQIVCDHDVQGVILENSFTPDFSSCIYQCARTEGCAGVGYLLQFEQCQLIQTPMGTVPREWDDVWIASYVDGPSSTTQSTLTEASSTTASPTCPGPGLSDGELVSENGQSFKIVCGTYANGYVLRDEAAPDFRSCISICAQDDACLGVNWYGENTLTETRCKLFETFINLEERDAGVWVAARPDAPSTYPVEQSSAQTSNPTSSETPTATAAPTCPGPGYSDGEVVNRNGKNLKIVCGSYLEGQELGNLGTYDFLNCIHMCGKIDACVGAAWYSPDSQNPTYCQLYRDSINVVEGDMGIWIVTLDDRPQDTTMERLAPSSTQIVLKTTTETSFDNSITITSETTVSTAIIPTTTSSIITTF